VTPEDFRAALKGGLTAIVDECERRELLPVLPDMERTEVLALLRKLVRLLERGDTNGP
jgi:hypothetical protein